jgi:pterin-4a-carbinolamine dehydratase
MDTRHRTRRDATAAQRIYVSLSRPLNTNAVVHTGGFATLDREIPFDSYITAIAFVRELRILAERFPTLLPSEQSDEGRMTQD